MREASTAQSEVGALTRVVLQHARDAFIDQKRVDAQWTDLGYAGRPDYDRAVGEYDAVVDVLEGAGVQTVYLAPDPSLTLDSLYVRDASHVLIGGTEIRPQTAPGSTGILLENAPRHG